MWYIYLVCFFSTKTIKSILCIVWENMYWITSWLLLCRDRPAAARRCACLYFPIILNYSWIHVYNLIHFLRCVIWQIRNIKNMALFSSRLLMWYADWWTLKQTRIIKENGTRLSYHNSLQILAVYLKIDWNWYDCY